MRYATGVTDDTDSLFEVENPWTPAHQAVELSDYDALSRLLDSGVDPNEACCGMTLLVHAIELEGDSAWQSGEPLNAASTAILLAYGADPRLSGPSGVTPMKMAQKFDHSLALRLLRRYGV